MADQKKPTKWDAWRDRWTSEQGLSIIAGYLRDGMTIETLCKTVIGCAKVTIYEWAKKSDELKDTLTITREAADMQVENSLFKKATGYKYTEQQLDRDGNPTDVERYMAPDVKAQALWLLNRRKKQWQEKQVIETQQSIQIQEAQGASQSILAALKARDIANMAAKKDDGGLPDE